MTFFSKYPVIFLIAATYMASTSSAHEYLQGSITVEHPWSRPTPPKARMGVVYMTLKNSGESADTLLSVKCDCAKSAEMHRTETDSSGKSSMRQQAQVEVAAQGVAEFAPGGLHVMLMGLNAALEEGSRFPITLEFAKAGKLKVDVLVENKPSDASKIPQEAVHDGHNAHKHHE